MERIVLVFALFGLPGEPLARELKALENLARVRPDVELAVGFERCGAPPEVYARLQDELLFAIGAEGFLPRMTALAGRKSGQGIAGLLVAGRGSEVLAVVPAKHRAPPPDGTTGATPPTQRLDDSLVAVGDLALLRGRTTPGAAPLEPPSSREAPGRRCAWMVARPAWVRGDEPPASATGWNVLRSVAAIRSLTATVDFVNEIELTLRVVAADAHDAVVLADGLEQFLASRRANRDASEAVRSAVERGTVERHLEFVTLRLPLSRAALERVKRHADSRTLLRLRLEDGERERWQRVAEVLRALDVHEGDNVADVGAGDGFFTLRLARVVGGNGRAFGVEIGANAVAALSRRAGAASFHNIEAILGVADDPRLPRSSLDAAVIVNAYHEMTLHEAMLARLFEALKPGGRLVLVEPWSRGRRGEPRVDQVKDHVIAPEIAEEELRRAGFAIVSRDDDFIPRERRAQWLIAARRPYTVVDGS